MQDNGGPDFGSKASAPAGGVKRRRPFLMAQSPRAAAVLMVSHALLGTGQAFLARSNSLLWLRVVVVACFLMLAVGYAITLINLRRHPELVKPYKAWWT